MAEGQENVHIHGDMTDEISDALADVRRSLERADDAFDRAGRSGAKAGTEMDRGMSKAKRSTDRARDSAGRFARAADDAGDEAAQAGVKAAAGSVGVDKWARSASKASRAAGGLGATMLLIKFGAFLTGGIAVVGMLAALASGAVMATGALSPMIGTVGALIPMMGLLAATMGLMKISGEDIKALLRPLGNEFKAMRSEITQSMVPGIQKFNSLIATGLGPTIRTGLVGLGGTFGQAAVRLGEMLTQGRNVSMMSRLFAGLNPIVLLLFGSLGRFLRVFMTLGVGALPMLTSMAEGLDRVSIKLDAWSARMVDSGRAQAWMLKSWELMKSSGRTLRDYLIGLYHLFRLAGIVAREEFGGGLSKSAADFRAWTTSAEGSQRILRYFRESVPALKETLELIKAITVWFGHLAADSRVAPLINQIRTELVPAFKSFMESLMGAGGFGPAVIDLFTALFTVLGSVPLDGLTLFLQALGGLMWAIAWMVNNVPGFGVVLGGLITTLVAAGFAFKVIGMGASVFGWVAAAATGTGKLSIAQKALHGVLNLLGPALRMVGTGLLFVGRAMWGLLANPLGIALMVLIGILLLVWWKWDWVKNAFLTGIRYVADFFVWLGKAIAQPFIDLWNIVKGVYNFIAGGWNAIPPIKIPDWVPFIGGNIFELPKLPLLAHGGMIEYGTAIVGEQGPEALVSGGRFLGMVGLQGPELRTDLPRGGYVVPNLDTLSRIPGLTAQLPGSVADAVAGALPGYGALLRRGTPSIGAPGVRVTVDTGSGDVVEAIDHLTAALLARRDPPPAGQDTAAALLRALRGADQRDALARRYSYVSGRH